MDYTIATAGSVIWLLGFPCEFIYYILPRRLPDLPDETFLHPMHLLGQLGIADCPFETYAIQDEHIETIRNAFHSFRGPHRQRWPEPCVPPPHAIVAPDEFLLHVMSFSG